MNSNAYMAEYMRQRYHSLRAEGIALLGGRCVRCGSTDDLQFDHIDPATKTLDIGRRWSSRPKFLAELAKCQLLCGEHHRAKTSAEQSVEHGGGLTGKRNCRCALCAPLKRARQRVYRQAQRERLAASV